MMSLPSFTRRLVKEREVPSFEVREVPVSVPRGDELLVRVAKVALCGTDINLYQWNDGGCEARGRLYRRCTQHDATLSVSSQWQRR